MPTYEYACTSCGHAWEAEQRITEAALDARIPPEVFTPASLARPAPRPAGFKKL